MKLTAAGRRALFPVFALAALLAGCDTQAPDARPLTVLEAPQGCDPQQGCRSGAGDLSVQLRFDAPARALQPFPVTIEVDGDAPVDAVTVSFLMRGMDMGLNRYRLESAAGGRWQGSVTLPVCVSGRSDWIAAIELTTRARRYQVQMPFVLQK